MTGRPYPENRKPSGGPRFPHTQITGTGSRNHPDHHTCIWPPTEVRQKT